MSVDAPAVPRQGLQPGNKWEAGSYGWITDEPADRCSSSFSYLTGLQIVFQGLGLSLGSDSAPHAGLHWALSLVEPLSPFQTFRSVFP